MKLFSLGRDPLRDIPQQSPLVKRKPKYSSTWIPEDLHVLSEEARDHLYHKLNRLNERRPSKEIPTIPNKLRATSVTDDDLDKRAAPQRPGLRRRPFSVAVGIADLGKQTEKMLNEKRPEQELSHQQSESDGEESLSAQTESSAIDSEYSEVEETRSRKISTQSSARNSLARMTPNRAKHVVISSFFAEESGEVSLEEGEEVEVLQKQSSGWWYVKNDFCEGWAPSSFLAPARSRSPSPETPNEPQVSDSQEESCQIKEILDTCPKEEGAKETKFVPPKIEKVAAIFLVTDLTCLFATCRIAKIESWFKHFITIASFTTRYRIFPLLFINVFNFIVVVCKTNFKSVQSIGEKQVA